MRLYLDASALVKLLIREPATEQVERLWEGAREIVSSAILYPEARAALAAANRARRLSRRGLGDARAALDLRWRFVYPAAVDDEVAVSAGQLSEALSLRALDAIHLATAVALATDELVVATWDTRLATAARRAGLAVAP
ncbi:MAG: type II toxin-antitoxin system VapC family toxin [Gaiellaceae bacterium]